MLNRNGKQTRFFIVSMTGKRTEMKTEADLLTKPGGIKNNLLHIPAKNRVRALKLLASITLKKLMNQEYNERHEFMNLVFDIHHIEIEFDGRILQLPFGGDLWFMLYHQIFIKNQYDLTEKNTKGKVIVDAGANIGAFSIFAACLGAKKVYAFEPVKETYEALKTNIQACGFEKIIIPVNKGLGDNSYKTKIKCDYAGDGGASIFTRVRQPKHCQTIEIVSLDGFLKGEKIDMIKMDTEGCEEFILVGARNTIATCAPTLTFSAYHKPTDKTRLPEVIHGIRSGYVCKLNTFYEEVMYCG